MYFAQALRAALERRGVSIGGGTEVTIDNWFAEMLVKILGRERGSGGSWTEGLAVVRQFLVDSVGIDSAAFSLRDGSGLARGNLVTLRDRLAETPLDGRLAAKTGSLGRVNSLARYLDRPGGGTYVFAILANNHAVSSTRAVAQIDSLVMEIGR